LRIAISWDILIDPETARKNFLVSVFTKHTSIFLMGLSKDRGCLGDMKGYVKHNLEPLGPLTGELCSTYAPWHSKGQQGQWKFTNSYEHGGQLETNCQKSGYESFIHDSRNASPFSWFSDNQPDPPFC
jgi:hypothetical protein